MNKTNSTTTNVSSNMNVMAKAFPVGSTVFVPRLGRGTVVGHKALPIVRLEHRDVETLVSRQMQLVQLPSSGVIGQTRDPFLQKAAAARRAAKRRVLAAGSPKGKGGSRLSKRHR